MKIFNLNDETKTIAVNAPFDSEDETHFTEV